jgi:hypothetical protein
MAGLYLERLSRETLQSPIIEKRVLACPKSTPDAGSDYSCRNATIGSTFVARRAGK